MTLAFFHIGLGLLVFAAFCFSFHAGLGYATIWNGIFTIVNFTYAGYLLSNLS